MWSPGSGSTCALVLVAPVSAKDRRILTDLPASDIDPLAMATPPEVFARLRMRRPIERAMQSGAIPVYDVGGWRRVRWADVLTWLEAQRVRPTPHARARLREVLERERLP